MDSKTLWLKVKKLVRIHENDKACLIFDDTIIEKQYMDENDIVCWHWDHQDGRNVKGINLLTAFYTAVNKEASIRIPLGYEIIAKTERYFDGKEGKEKRRSPKTKNELMREMINAQIANRVKFRYILADSWFSSNGNMKFINKRRNNHIGISDIIIAQTCIQNGLRIIAHDKHFLAMSKYIPIEIYS